MFGSLFKKKKEYPSNKASFLEIEEYFNNLSKNPNLYKKEWAEWGVDILSPRGKEKVANDKLKHLSDARNRKWGPTPALTRWGGGKKTRKNRKASRKTRRNRKN